MPTTAALADTAKAIATAAAAVTAWPRRWVMLNSPSPPRFGDDHLSSITNVKSRAASPRFRGTALAAMAVSLATAASTGSGSAAAGSAAAAAGCAAGAIRVSAAGGSRCLTLDARFRVRRTYETTQSLERTARLHRVTVGAVRRVLADPRSYMTRGPGAATGLRAVPRCAES